MQIQNKYINKNAVGSLNKRVSYFDQIFPAGICLFKVNSGNTGAIREICSVNNEDTRNTSMTSPVVFIVNFEQIWYIVVLLTLNK